MIIHDLKHPTEALVESLKHVHQDIVCMSAELLEVKEQNELLTRSLENLKAN
jgi:hypothetical protein